MQINVSQLLQEPIGASREYKVDEVVDITGDGEGSMVKGECRLLRTQSSILTKCSFSTDIKLTCSRCLSQFGYKLSLDFEEEYVRQYGQLAMAPRGGIEIIGIAVIAFASPIKPVFRKLDYVGPDPLQAFENKRDVFFKRKWIETNVYNLQKLQCGNVIEGPAIIEGADTTVVVPDDRKVTVDEYANLIMEQL